MSDQRSISPRPWSVTTKNLAEHQNNKIHTDAGARAAGFPAALVAGVTTYAYLTHPIVEAFGVDWLRSGGGEVRFLAPVFAEHELRLDPQHGPAGVRVEALHDDEERNPRAVLDAVFDVGEPPPLGDGEALPSRTVRLEGQYGHDYGWRAGDTLGLYDERQVVPPAVWPALANAVFSAELVDGPWIHTRSVIRHHGLGTVGSSVDIHAVVVDRFARHGERAVADLIFEIDGVVVASIEHEAIVRLPERPTEA